MRNPLVKLTPLCLFCFFTNAVVHQQRVRERQAAAQAKEDADMEELRTRLDAVKA